MTTNVNLIIALFCTLLLSSCVTPPKARKASEYLLTSDKSVTIVLKDLRTQLEEKKYKVAKIDVAAGLLILAPRSYSFLKSGIKVNARQTVQLRQEGGSVKVRIVYECNYSGQNGIYVGCLIDDNDSNAKIKRIEPALIELIRPILMKHNDAEKPAEKLESFEDWGKN